MTDTPYSPEVQKLLEMGRPEGSYQPDSCQDYRELGLTKAHIPELIRLVQDEALRFADLDIQEAEAEEALPDLDDFEEEAEFPPQVFAQIHAWRALGQLQAVEAVPALIGLLPQVDKYDDEWALEDLPEIFALIGPECIEPLRAFTLDRSHSTYDRVAAIEGLVKVGEKHPQAKSRCVEVIAEGLKDYQQEDEVINSFLIHALTHFEAVEHLPLIQAAYEADTVDTMLQGDFDDVRADLGLIPRPKRNTRPFLAGLERSRAETPFERENQAVASNKAKKKEKARRKQEKKSRKKNRRR